MYIGLVAQVFIDSIGITELLVILEQVRLEIVVLDSFYDLSTVVYSLITIGITLHL